MSTHPKAHQTISDPEIVPSRFRPTFAVRDPITGQTIYLRDEDRAGSYAGAWLATSEQG